MNKLTSNIIPHIAKAAQLDFDQPYLFYILPIYQTLKRPAHI